MILKDFKRSAPGFYQYFFSGPSMVLKDFYKRLLGACWALVGLELEMR